MDIKNRNKGNQKTKGINTTNHVNEVKCNLKSSISTAKSNQNKILKLSGESSSGQTITPASVGRLKYTGKDTWVAIIP